MKNEKLNQLRAEIMGLIRQYSQEYEKISVRKNVPVSGKKIGEEEFMGGVNAILDGHWTDGPYAVKFEQMLCDYVGVEHANFVNSGSSANLLALTALLSPKMGKRRTNKGDEVITAACSFPTTVNPIVQNSLIPVFCDMDLETYNIDIDDLKKAISKKSKAVFVAHTLGNPFNIKAVKEICDEHNLFLIEDCCDALGSLYDGKKVGTFGDLATCSFYPAHHITSIEGGAVLTNDALLNSIVVSMRDWGRDCYCLTGKDNTCGKRFDYQKGKLPEGYDHKFIFSDLGYNLKATDINAAIGIEQIKKIDDFRAIRERNFKRLYEGLKKFEDILILPKDQPNSHPSWFGFIVTLRENCKFTRRELLKFLDEKGVGSRLLFGGNITNQPYFIDYDIIYRQVGNLHNTDIIMNNSFWLGNCQLLDDHKIDFIIESINQFCHTASKI